MGNPNTTEHPGITPGGEQYQDENLDDVPQISLKGETRNKSEDEGGQVEEFGKHERGYRRSPHVGFGDGGARKSRDTNRRGDV